MAPRLPVSGSIELCSLASSNCSTLPARTSPLELALRTCKAASRSFSITPHRNSTLPASRYKFYQWMKREGKELKKAKPGDTNYLSGLNAVEDAELPFPSNPMFHSQPVLSDESRDEIHHRVINKGEPIMVVSADLGVDHRRVAAVVRMKEVEKEWKEMGKTLAGPYARAVMSMLPTHDTMTDMSYIDKIAFENIKIPVPEGTDPEDAEFYELKADTDTYEYQPTEEEAEFAEMHAAKLTAEQLAQQNAPPPPFEPINEIHVHGLTMQQLFVPTSESRHFTREDAAKAFNERMLSADARIPHKELVKYHRRVHEGVRAEKSRELFVEGARAAQQADVLRDSSKKDWEARLTVAVPTERSEFRFKKITVEDGGFNGRSRRGVGWRYGAPSEGRKKDQVKHPVKYE